MIDTSMAGKDIWVKYTGTDGMSFVMFHRVFDIDRFMFARNAEKKVGCKVERVTNPNPPKEAPHATESA